MSFQSIVRFFRPGFWSGRNIGILTESVGLTFDGLAERSFLGRCAAIPYAAGAKTAGGIPLQCEEDVLPWHARDRMLSPYPTSTPEGFRVQLSRFRQIHARSGTHRGEMEALQPYCLPGKLPRIFIVHQAGSGLNCTWHKLSGDEDTGGAGRYTVFRKTPSNWNFDGVTWKTLATITGATNVTPIAVTAVAHGLRTGQRVGITGVTGNTAANGVWIVTVTGVDTFTIAQTGNGMYAGGGIVRHNLWSRYWVIIETTGTRIELSQSLYDDGHLYDGGQVYDGVPAAHAADIYSILTDTKKSAHSIMWGLILCPSGSFSPSGTSAVLADGSTSYPAGNWGALIDPTTHLPTRPAYASFYRDLGQA